MRALGLITATVAMLLALAGCAKPWEGTALDEWGWYACQDFSEQVSKSGGGQMVYQLQPLQRAEFVQAVSEATGYSDTAEIKDAGVVMARTVGASQSAWQLATDTFAQRCIDRGFNS